MEPDDCVALYRRRGSVLVWQHANPTDPEDVDPLTQGVRLSAGGRREKFGKMGETYSYGYRVFGYLQSKIASTFSEVFGMVDDRQMQLTVPARHSSDVSLGIRPLPADLEALYTAGKFITHDKGGSIARDRFVHAGINYVVKASSVPIIDHNVTIAWRMLVAADTL